MTRAELLALAERVEAATGPDRALEEEIDLVALDLGWRAERKEVPFDAPHYTSSIDAAASLMPKGCEALVRWRRSAATFAINAYAHVWPIDGPMPFPAWESRAHSAARALTAAALRARAEGAGE